MQNEEFDAGADPELDDDEIWYSDDPQEAKKLSLQTKAKAFVPIVGLLVAAVFFLPSTVGGKITIGSGGGIEFGQGVSQIVTCGASPVNLTVTPNSDFANASNSGTHYFKSIKVSGITAACVGVDFKLRAYDNSSSNPLAIFDTNKTVAVVSVVSTSNFEPGTGSSGTSISDAAGAFTVTFTSPVAVSTTVAKLTIETGPQYVLNQSANCGGAGTFTISNNVVTTSSVNCSGSLTIPLGVTAIASSAFADRAISGSVTLPAGISTIGSGAFARNGSGFSINIPSSVTNINAAFFRSSVSSVTFASPSSLTTIGDDTFRSAGSGGSLRSITIPDAVTSLGARVFSDQSLPNNPFSSTSMLQNMGTSTFHSAPSFTTFVIPGSVTTIGDSVFLNVQQLKRLTIPSSVTSISATAFVSVPALNCVIYSGSNSVVLNYTFPNSAPIKTDSSQCPAL